MEDFAFYFGLLKCHLVVPTYSGYVSVRRNIVHFIDGYDMNQRYGRSEGSPSQKGEP